MGWLGDILTVGLGAAGVDTNPAATKSQKDLANKMAEEAEKKRLTDERFALLALQQKSKSTIIIAGAAAGVLLIVGLVIAVAIKQRPAAVI